MTVKSGQTWSGLIVCKDSTGALATPSVGPVGALYVNGTVNAASVTVTGSNPYKWTLTLPALTAGDTVSMYITATIATIATAEVVAEEIADTIRLSDGVTVNSIANNAITAAAIATAAIDADAIADGAIDAATFASGSITAAAIAADAIGASELAADAVAEIWAYSSRTLTQSAAAVSAAVAGSSITILRGDTVTIALTGLGALTGYVSLDFTVKGSPDDSDAAAILRVRKNASGVGDGLIILNGATATTAAQGSIAINDAALGNITITLAAAATATLTPRIGLYYDVQMITASIVDTLTNGNAEITADITRLLA